MKSRYDKIVLEAGEGIKFEVSETDDDVLKIRAYHPTNYVQATSPIISAGEYAKSLSFYVDKEGNTAVVPPGWTVSGVNKENIIWGKGVSLVIYRIPRNRVRSINWDSPEETEYLKRNYDQFVWCPIKFLDANGTLDGEKFSRKFGRRDYCNDEFSDDEYNETANGELLEQLESINKYGGFYISRYNISENSQRKPQSVKGVMPWVNISFNNASEIAITFEKNEIVQSHLTFGAEYDSMLAWLIKSKTKNLFEIAKDSTNWGNYSNSENSLRAIAKTGSREEWCANNIYDISGNVDEWTQEKSGNLCAVVRGGDCLFGGNFSAACRGGCPAETKYEFTGFRIALKIE